MAKKTLKSRVVLAGKITSQDTASKQRFNVSGSYDLWIVDEGEWAPVDRRSSTSPNLSHKKRSKPLLTKREREIVILISKGQRNKGIANALFLSPETVKKHIYRVFQKLDAHNRVDMLNKLKEKGLLP